MNSSLLSLSWSQPPLQPKKVTVHFPHRSVMHLIVGPPRNISKKSQFTTIDMETENNFPTEITNTSALWLDMASGIFSLQEKVFFGSTISWVSYSSKPSVSCTPSKSCLWDICHN